MVDHVELAPIALNYGMSDKQGIFILSKGILLE
jgi:hypothetical protein